MTAEQIARVVSDLRAGNYKLLTEKDTDSLESSIDALQHAEVIDATTIYHQICDGPRKGYAVYEDFVLCPPWLNAAVCWTNPHGNVILVHFMAVDRDERVVTEDERPFDTYFWEDGHPEAEKCRWEEVRWVGIANAWVGGMSTDEEGTVKIRTGGPLHGWSFAIYENGTPGDIRWRQYHENIDNSVWDNVILTLMATMNFCNCRNIELVEPSRPRAERRRLERMGAPTITELRVRPIGRYSRPTQRRNFSDGVPLTTVRGHFSHYGTTEQHGNPRVGDRELLFGRISGRFWIPQFVRGNPEFGTVTHAYKMEDE